MIIPKQYLIQVNKMNQMIRKHMKKPKTIVSVYCFRYFYLNHKLTIFFTNAKTDTESHYANSIKGLGRIDVPQKRLGYVHVPSDRLHCECNVKIILIIDYGFCLFKLIDLNRIFYFVTDNKKSRQQIEKMQMTCSNTFRKCLYLLIDVIVISKKTY